MDMYPKYISPFGYQTNNGKIDSYGVDHSGFTTRDELEYQFARDKREQDLMNQYNAQGIIKNFPQYGTNFWGNSANNYGFGMTNIADNITNMKNTTTPIPVATAIPQQQVPNNIKPQNTLANVTNDVIQLPYVFSQDMRNKLGNLESNNQYNIHITQGGGMGAFGKYQIRQPGLIDIGYMDRNGNWTGKNGIYSANDFLNSPQKQEQILDEYLKSNYQQLKNKGALAYLGIPMHGLVNDFDITNTGLLAASHREGAGAVNNYLNNLVKNQNGRYYINYDGIADNRLSEMFKRIETRLRNFEK